MPVLGCACAIVQCQHADERRLAGAVRSENRGVLTLADGEGKVLQHTRAAAHQGGAHDLQHRFH
jgi:hypothetical protein